MRLAATISIHSEPEPFKPWRKQAPLLEIQNLKPDELNNLAGVGEYSENISSLYKKLVDLQKEVGDDLDLSGMGIK